MCECVYERGSVCVCVALRRPPCSLTPCPVLAKQWPLEHPPHLHPPTPTEACPGTHPLPVTLPSPPQAARHG